eukprot:318712-Rhodomonas_salina.1
MFRYAKSHSPRAAGSHFTCSGQHRHGVSATANNKPPKLHSLLSAKVALVPASDFEVQGGENTSRGEPFLRIHRILLSDPALLRTLKERRRR